MLRMNVTFLLIFLVAFLCHFVSVTVIPGNIDVLIPRSQVYQCLPTQQQMLRTLLQGIGRLAIRAAVLTVSPRLGDDYLQEKFILHFKELLDNVFRLLLQRRVIRLADGFLSSASMCKNDV